MISLISTPVVPPHASSAAAECWRAEQPKKPAALHTCKTHQDVVQHSGIFGILHIPYYTKSFSGTPNSMVV